LIPNTLAGTNFNLTIRDTFSQINWGLGKTKVSGKQDEKGYFFHIYYIFLLFLLAAIYCFPYF